MNADDLRKKAPEVEDDAEAVYFQVKAQKAQVDKEVDAKFDMDSVADNNSEDELNDFLAGVAPKED